MAGAKSTDWQAEAAVAQRTEAARRLFEEAQETGSVSLVVLSAMQRWVLGGAQQVLIEEAVAKSWNSLGRWNQRKIAEHNISSLLKRGLLLEKPTGTEEPTTSSCSVAPELGIVLAARCRPTFVLTHETVGRAVRSVRYFGLGDDQEPVRGIVEERPDYAASKDTERKLGPLAWIYEYFLDAPRQVASGLAELALYRDAGVHGDQEPRVQVFSGFPHHTPELAATGHPGIRLAVRGLGATGQIVQPDDRGGLTVVAEHDLEGMTAVMADLVATLSG